MPLYWVTEEEAKIIRLGQALDTWLPSVLTDCVHALNQTRETRARPFSFTPNLPSHIRSADRFRYTAGLGMLADLFSDVEQHDQRVTHVIMSCSWCEESTIGVHIGAAAPCLESLHASQAPASRYTEGTWWGAALWLVKVDLPTPLRGFALVCTKNRDLTAPQQSSILYLLDE